MTKTREIVKKLVDELGNGRESLLPILQGIIREERFLSPEAMREVAEKLDISAAEVYGTASFFSYLDTEERGQYVIRICKSVTCDLKGKCEIIDVMEDMLKIKVGETTVGKRFSLLETNCIGLCDQGPAMLVNDDYYTKLTPTKVREILGTLIRNEN